MADLDHLGSIKAYRSKRISPSLSLDEIENSNRTDNRRFSYFGLGTRRMRSGLQNNDLFQLDERRGVKRIKTGWESPQ